MASSGLCPILYVKLRTDFTLHQPEIPCRRENLTTSMNTRFLLFVCLSAGIANAVPPKEVTTLRERYDAAIVKATKPVTELYRRELMALLDRYKRANDVASMAAVTEELTRLDAEAATAAAQGEGDGDRLFVGRSWYSAAKAEYHFSKDGKGYRSHGGEKVPLTWRRVDGGLIEVTGKMAPNAPPRIWFFKFEDRKKAQFGTSRDALTDPATAER